MTYEPTTAMELTAKLHRQSIAYRHATRIHSGVAALLRAAAVNDDTVSQANLGTLADLAQQCGDEAITRHLGAAPTRN